jgi:glycopeptide antibiotics resistance protein
VPGGVAVLRSLRETLDAGGFLLVVVAAVVVLLLLVAALRARAGRAGDAVARVVVLIATCVVLAGIAELTLFGTQGLGAAQRVELDPIAGAWGWSGIAWRPVIDNVTLFVPLGAVLASLWPRRSWIVPLGAAVLVSVGVEVFQWAYPSGRIANSADVIANSVGALLGIVLARVTGAAGRAGRAGRA